MARRQQRPRPAAAALYALLRGVSGPGARSAGVGGLEGKIHRLGQKMGRLQASNRDSSQTAGPTCRFWATPCEFQVGETLNSGTELQVYLLPNFNRIRQEVGLRVYARNPHGTPAFVYRWHLHPATR